MPPIASLSSPEPLMSPQTLDAGSRLWPYLVSALFPLLLCLFGLYDVWRFQGQRARRLYRRRSDVELGTASTNSLRIARKAPSGVRRPAPAPVRPSAESQSPAAARGATRRPRIPGWPPRSRVEAQAFLRRRTGLPPRFPPDAFPAGDGGGGAPSGGTAVGVRQQRRRRRLAVSSSRE